MTLESTRRCTIEDAATDGRWRMFQRGSLIYRAEEEGSAWRVVSVLSGWTAAMQRALLSGDWRFRAT